MFEVLISVYVSGYLLIRHISNNKTSLYFSKNSKLIKDKIKYLQSFGRNI